MVYLAQFLQFGGFALFTPASVYFINMALEEEDRNAGLEVMLVVSTLFCGFAIVLMTMSKNSYLKANLKKV